MLKLYRITQNEKTGYDTFDSAIVCAEDENAAKKIHPAEGMDAFSGFPSKEEEPDVWTRNPWCWCSHPDAVKVSYLGIAAGALPKGAILASYNAG